MSAGLFFNLDDLNNETFQELCAAIVLKEFTPLAIPYGARGRDGGIDAKHNGELLTYTEFFNDPFMINTEGDEQRYWIFQAKHTRKNGAEAQETVIRNMEDELEKWITKEERGGIPKCFILMTNVRLIPSTREKLEEMGQWFEYFECWDEAKIAAFIVLHETVQRTFFPNKDDRCLEAIAQLNTTMQRPGIEIEHSKRESSIGSESESNVFDFTLAVDKLIGYEINFTTQNNAIGELIEVGNDIPELDSLWEIAHVKADRDGIVKWDLDKEALELLIELIRMKNLFVFHWSTLVGEKVSKGEDIILFKCLNEDIEKVKDISHKLFKVVDGDNQAHAEVNAYLEELQGEIITEIQANRLVRAENILSKLYKARDLYLKKKQSHPYAFYPNARTMGGRTVWGWDFIAVWDDVYTGVLKYVLEKQGLPADFVEKMIWSAFYTCDSLILFKAPANQFKVSFTLVCDLLFILEEYKKTDFQEAYFDRYKRLCVDASDTEYRVDDLKTAENSLAIIIEIYKCTLRLVKAVLDGELSTDLSVIEKCINYLTGANFSGMLVHLSSDWDSAYARQKEIHALLKEKKDDFYFAWATYLWFQKRAKSDFNFDEVIKIISKVSLDSIIDLYEKAKDRETGWLGSWFIPRGDGRIVTYSRAIDHDIRELFISVLLTREFSAEELMRLELLESDSSTDDFLKDVKAMYDKMTVVNQKLSTVESISDIVLLAKEKVQEKITDRLIMTTSFSEKKIKHINETFLEKMASNSKEGRLYEIQEGLNKKDVKLQVGVHSIKEKKWFTEDSGHISYSSHSFGSQWAEAIISGRDQVIIMTLLNKMKSKIKEITLEKLLKLLSECEEEHFLFIPFKTLPIEKTHHLIEHRRDDKSSKSFIGKVQLVYLNRNLKEGEAFLVRKNSITWNVVKKVELPEITLIEPGSEAERVINQSEPGVNPALRVIVNAQELGDVKINKNSKIYYFRVKN